jgi:hypothetical protein
MERRLNKNEKIVLIILSVLFILLLLFKSPALARFKNRSLSSSNVWSGEIATKYKSGDGTIDNPYIISNGEELAYFSSMLENNNYEGKYFKLINNIRINEGVFKYEDDKVEYIINDTVYYVKDDSYYNNDDFHGDPIGSINIFPSLNNFKGHFDGDSHVIYGLYMNSNNSGLFTNLSGEVDSLYISNAFIHGNNSGILSNSITSGSVSNIMVDGYVLSDTYEGTDDILSISGNYTVSGGISSYISDSILVNCINKSEIYGSFVSGGIVGYMEDSSIINAYSTSNLYSYSSNTIGIIKGTSVVDRVYNTGVINGGLFGYVLDSDFTVSNSFITTDNDLIVGVSNSNITSSNNYFTFTGRGDNLSSSLATDSDLKDKEFLSSYDEFFDFEDLDVNPFNTWVFEDDMYPVLYIDDIINPFVELNLGSYMWNSYSHILDNKQFGDNITFMISDVDDVHNYDKYYYISNSRTSLSKSDLENVTWVPYNDIVQITEEGFYVVYVKVVNGNDVSYINSDLLILDKTGSDIDITLDNNHYSSINDSTIYLDHSFNISVSASDALSGIKSVEYYISNDFISDYNVNWNSYSDTISFNNVGEYVLYVKVTDGCDFVTYASTPLIIYDGYVSSVHPLGFDSGDSITSNSSIVYNFSYSNNKELNFTHNLISSILLPRYTNITLIDKVNNKVYGYIVNSNDRFGFDTNGYATYPFSLFKEKGKSSNVNYVDGTVTNEQFDIIVDFSKASISTDYNNVYLYLEGNSSGVVRPTISKSSFSIDSSRNARVSHSLSSDYSSTIYYNSDSIHNVTIDSIVNYGNSYDTSYFDKKIGLSIKLVDSSGRIVNREHLKNFAFMIGDDNYTPSNDNIIRINLNTNSSVNTDLSIITHQGTSKLKDGTYYLKINAYSSLDGFYYDSVIDNGVMIPVVVSKNYNSSSYGFDVSIDSDSRIIDKNGIVNLSFVLKQSGLESPNIKVSMFAKDEVTAYNQDYTLIDLGDYSDISLEEFIDSVYYVSRNPLSESIFSFDLDTSLLDKTSYRFVFDLYDGNLKVGSISKNIIIR